jgi:predicted metal-dependent peptidase
MNRKLYELSIWFNTNNLLFYSEILLSTNFEENEAVGTAGVRTTINGLQFVYSPKFINNLSKDSINFVGIHEIYHFLHRHQNRSKYGNKIKENIVMDMVINTLIEENYNNLIDIKKIKEEIYPVFIPKEYKGRKIFEELYEWIEDRELPKQYRNQEQNNSRNNEQNKQKNNSGNNNQKDGKENEENGDDIPDNIKDVLNKRSKLSQETKDLIDKINDSQEEMTIDIHLPDTVSKEMRDQIVNDIIESCKTRGLIKGNSEAILKQLRPSKKDYLKPIKRSLSSILGGKKHNTWSKPNRKGLPFKGFRKYSTIINCLVDVSGSMCGEFEKVFSFIFQNNITINLIQIDTEVQAEQKIRNKKELQRVKIKGLGGTTLQPGVNYIKKKFNKYNTVILTDGECDSLDFSGIKGKVLILTTRAKVNFTNGRKVKQIFIEKEE